MAIYLRVEVVRRELGGRLLLGLALAEQGHEVVVGRIPYSALLAGELNGWVMPPGVIHLKSLNVTPRLHEWLKTLRSRGFSVTAQDEEHGLAGPDDYRAFAESRLSEAQMSEAQRYFAWGRHDGDWLSNAYPDLASRISVTGSPRMDLFRPELLAASPQVVPALTKPYVLIVSSAASPFKTNPLWLSLGLERETHGELDEQRELNRFRSHAEATLITGQLLAAARRLSRRVPGTPVVIRPHHKEAPDAWESVVGSNSGITVASGGPSVSWIAGAAVVVHSGSTVALESTIAGKPVVSFTPEISRVGRRADSFGMQTKDVDGLVAAVERAIVAPEAWAGTLARDRERLSSVLDAVEGDFAADRIAEAMGALDPGKGGDGIRLTRSAASRQRFRRSLGPALPMARAVRGMVGRHQGRKVRGQPSEVSLLSRMDFAHKFPSLDFDTVTMSVERISRELGRFSGIRVTRIGEKEVLLRRG